jgi:hypothetical protein
MSEQASGIHIDTENDVLRVILCKNKNFQIRGGQVTSPILLKFDA